MAENRKMIDGTLVTLRGREFVVPPMSFGQLRRTEPHFEVLRAGGDFTPKTMDAILAIIVEALSTNYPGTTAMEVEDLLDPVNIGDAINAIMGAAGMKKSGEALAGN